MSFNTIGDALKSKSREVSPAFSEVAIFKHLIKERVHALDLIRELLSCGRKGKINKTQKPYKFTMGTDEYQVHIYAIKYMDGIKVLSRNDLEKRGIKI